MYMCIYMYMNYIVSLSFIFSDENILLVCRSRRKRHNIWNDLPLFTNKKLTY